MTMQRYKNVPGRIASILSVMGGLPDNVNIHPVATRQLLYWILNSCQPGSTVIKPAGGRQLWSIFPILPPL
ncbi:hypothetical protein [Chitinophaga defluvii]|uniref:Uncharacterized protein n=1 Tax=Chitinophaga defluvii TaxID=3163343 RepID=A0ABV2T8E5_9BACT